MNSIDEKFKKLGIENAPGQEKLQSGKELELRGGELRGVPVDFSHGDVDAFQPLPGSFEAFAKGYAKGAEQAYTEYRGSKAIREDLAYKLSAYTGTDINPKANIIITPGTQGALFLAMGSLIGPGDKVAIVEPDYFANRKLVEFFEGELVPVKMDYEESSDRAGLDLKQLEQAFLSGVKLFLFSNPNNPVGAVYSYNEIGTIAALAKKYNVALIIDELYSRQIFDKKIYTHLCAQKEIPDNLITVTGPSKTESLSGFRLGVAFGTKELIMRMEKLQAIVSLRAAGYGQAVLSAWFREPEGFMEERIKAHQNIRDELVAKLRTFDGITVRPTDAGSYLFPKIPPLDVDIKDFCKIVRELAEVTITPGTEFGPQFINHFRINFSQDAKAASEAIDRLLRIMERYCR